MHVRSKDPNHIKILITSFLLLTIFIQKKGALISERPFSF